jgi:hypothetical protein
MRALVLGAPGDEAESKRVAGTNLRDFDGGTQKSYQHMIEAMDAQIGRVLNALDANGGVARSDCARPHQRSGRDQHGLAADALGRSRYRIGPGLTARRYEPACIMSM